jgi:hypothetical protein
MIKLCDLLVAVLGETCRVAPGRVLLNVDHSGFEGEIIRLFRHAQLFLPNLGDSFKFVGLRG